MSFQFQPKNDDQINAYQNRGLLPEGAYVFTVLAAEYGTSKSGNAMLKLKLTIHEQDGSKRSIFDNLMAMESMIYKTKHFCDATGLEAKYTAGSFTAEDCIGRSGLAKIGIQKGNAKEDGSGFYPDKNTIKDYIKPEMAMAPAQSIPSDINKDIKF